MNTDQLDQCPRAPRGRHHVCFVAPNAWPVLAGASDTPFVGGAEVQQCHLARGLAQRGYRVSMLCLDHGQPSNVVVDGVEVRRLFRPDAGLPVLRFVHPRLTTYWRAMKQADADVYYYRAAGMLAGVVATFCGRHGRKSIYAGASNTDFQPGAQMIRYARDRWLYEYGLRKVDAVVAQNQTQVQECKTHYGRDSELIHSCHPGRAGFSSDPNGDILWVSTLRRLKRPEWFIELARAFPQARFVMAGGPGGGDADSRTYFESIRQAASAVPNLRFLGFVPPAEIEQHFDRASLVLNTSEFEGFPNTFLQAWSRGIPTVSTVDTGSMEDGQPVCTTAQDVPQLIEHVRRLREDETAWRATGERCRRHFERRHSLPSVLDAYEALFEKLFAAKNPSGAHA